jgi:hypothetical protein
MTKEEYLELINKILEGSYSDLEEEKEEVKLEGAWIPAKPNLPAIKPGIIDLTSTKSKDILDSLKKGERFRIGKFTIRLNHSFNREVAKIEIWEDKTITTPAGRPFATTVNISVKEDDRFTNCSWIKYFTYGYSAFQVPIEVSCEIIRWLQAVTKLAAFL